MSNIIKIESYDDPSLDVYARLTGNQLKSRLDPGGAVIIAESPTVIGIALNAGLTPLSLLTDSRLVNDAVDGIIRRLEGMRGEDGNAIPIFTAERRILSQMTGFELTRGALCAMRRPAPKDAREIISNARRIAVLEGITDTTNIGAVFRSAAALNMDAVLMTPTCCDPLSRRALRVSMGTVMQVPFARIGDTPSDWPSKGMELLKEMGFATVAMALTDRSVPIDDPALNSEDKLAIILGTEGDGLAKQTVASADYTAKIPMSHGVDSLNVAAAGAVAFWQLGRKRL